MATPATTFSYHVSGPILIEAAIGVSEAFVPVGMCEDGADVELRAFTSDIKFDGAGGPAGDAGEIIFLNYTALVRCNLVPFAGVYTNRLRAISQASPTEGVMVMPGTLYGANGYLPSVRFAVSATGEVDGGWEFFRCQVRGPGSGKYSTRETKPQWEFRAINYIDPAEEATILNNTLYTRL